MMGEYLHQLLPNLEKYPVIPQVLVAVFPVYSLQDDTQMHVNPFRYLSLKEQTIHNAGTAVTAIILLSPHLERVSS